MKVELHFLVSLDVPVTNENLVVYGNKEFSELISECTKLEHKLEVYNSILMSDDQTSMLQNTLMARIIAV